MNRDKIYTGQKVRVTGDPRNWEVEPNENSPYGTKTMIRVWTGVGYEQDGVHEWGIVMYVLPTMLTDAECICWKCGSFAAEGEVLCTLCLRDQDCPAVEPRRSRAWRLLGRPSQ